MTSIETNNFLLKRNDELTKRLEDLVKNYEVLLKEKNEHISSLERRIKELIESKVSVSKTPKHWIEETFFETEEKENTEF